MHNCCSAPEKTEGFCPECNEKGKKVQRMTMEHLLQPSLVGQIAPGQYFFCENPSCQVVYFISAGGRAFCKGDLTVRVGLKETEEPIPVCYCFGYTRKMISDDLAASGKTEIPDKIKVEVQAGNCTCETENPSGICCLGNVHQIVKEGKERHIMSAL